MSEYPSDWSIRSLGKIAERVRRTSDDLNLAALTISSTEGWVDQRKKWARNMAGKSIETYTLLKKGEFSYNRGNSKTYPHGCIFRLESWEKALVPNVYHSFRIASPDIYDDFLKHFFVSGGLNDQLRSIITSSVRDNGLLNITADIFFSTEVPIPPLPEQKKIAEILSGIDRLMSLTNTREVAIKNLLQAAIGRMFSVPQGDCENSARRICDIVNPERQITYGIVQTGEKLPEGVPCVRVADFESGILDPSLMIKTSHEISTQYERTILQEGDLMVALRGDIGRTEIANNILAGANLTRGVALLSKSDTADPKYLRYAMRSPEVRRQIKDGTNGSALQEIPLKNLREILIQLPSKEQQFEQAVFLESIELLSTNLRTQRKSLELIKRAISSDLLSGRKRVSI